MEFLIQPLEAKLIRKKNVIGCTKAGYEFLKRAEIVVDWSIPY